MKIVGPQLLEDRKYVTPEEREGHFSRLLRKETQSQRINEPHCAIHVARKGAFLQTPDIFQYIDVTRYTTKQQNLSTTIYVKLNSQNKPF